MRSALASTCFSGRKLLVFAGLQGGLFDLAQLKGDEVQSSSFLASVHAGAIALFSQRLQRRPRGGDRREAVNRDRLLVNERQDGTGDREATDARAGRAARPVGRPVREGTPAVASAPLTNDRLRPWLVTSRRMTISPRWASSKMASIVAWTSPVRTRSADARAPRSRPTASTRIDFPAPVSPVRTLKPGSSSTSTASITARLRMRSRRSM